MKRILAIGLICAGFAQGQESRAKVALSLEKALEIALSPDGNTRLQLATELLQQAKAREGIARGALLPNVDGQFTYQNFTRNLQAFGIQTANLPPGIGFPSIAGPLDNFDARGTASLALFDLSAIKRYQAAKTNSAMAKEEIAAARNQAVAVVAKAYVAAQRANQVRLTAVANVELAQRTLRLASTQKDAGTGTGIEVTRGQVLLAGEQQKLLQADEDLAAARLQLMRAMNYPLDTDFNLTDAMSYKPADIPVAQAAVELARQSRPELRAQTERERAAKLSYDATKMERVPTATLFGDYGLIGIDLGNGQQTRTFGVQVKIPVWDGGRRDARRLESASLRKQEEIRGKDLRQQVEIEVRLALEALRSAENQVKVALEASALAEKELEQAERRFESGVAPGLEVTDAQTRLARSRENQVSALFRQRVARIDYGLAVGAPEQALQ